MVEEKLPVCPRNPKWLKAVHDFLGPELFKKSKLGRYYDCIKELVEKQE